MINVIGLGYIGLPTAMILAANGNEIIGTDYDKEKVDTLNSGKMTFEEEGIDDLFDKALKSGIKFTTQYISTDMYIITVPTPYDEVSKKLDVSILKSAIQSVLEVCKDGTTLIIESTISPGAIDKNIRPMIEDKGFKIGENIHLCHAPERIIPGNMMYELENNSRTIGVDDVEIGEKVKEIYSTFCKGEIIITDIRTAEMSKVVENTFRDINIAFANELAKICRSDNMDVYEIIRIANKHPRVNILSPGPGVGGHCIPVDPWFLVGDYPTMTDLILTARKTNDSMPAHVINRVNTIMKENNLKDVSKVGFYGLTYKENVDDVRESPTLQIVEVLEDHLAGNTVKYYDPMVKRDIVENQYHDLDKFLNDIELLVIMVGHNEIKENMDKLKDKIVLDTRNICDIEGVHKL